MGTDRRKLVFLFLILLADVVNGAVFFLLGSRQPSAFLQQFILGIACLSAAVFSVLSYILHRKGIKGIVPATVTTLAVLLNIPVAFYSVFWLLWALGLKLIPPPQQ